MKETNIVGHPLLPPRSLLGRGLGLRLKLCGLDMLPIAAYFPPKPRVIAARPNYLKTVELLTKWISDVLRRARGRTTPILA
eukprot:3163923-Pyramimonas_sp.AAC.1